MERICSEKYVPTPTDVLRARVRTNGIIETHFKINDVIVRYVKVELVDTHKRAELSVPFRISVLCLSACSMWEVRDHSGGNGFTVLMTYEQ
jgi:hypothetical protein